MALAKAPAHVESLIGLADLHVDVADKSQDDSNFDTAIELYTRALRHHAHGTGSKFLTSAEKAAIFYQRGYCAVQLYEAKPNVLRSRNLLKDALADFRRCLAIDPQHEKSRSAQRKLTEKASPFVRTARERYGPWLIVTCTIFVFVVAQVKYVAGAIEEASHIALTFGSVALAIAGLFLPELLKLKVGGVELEKSPVEQERRPSSFGLSR
jgi:tetratricopeptide (TPR) repeat protein